MPLKECFLDVETSGTDRKACAIMQVSGLICIDKKEIETFDIFVRPFNGAFIDPGALKTHGIEAADDRMIRSREAYQKLISIFTSIVDKYNPKDKMFFYAYNASFDWEFMWNWWEREGDHYFGSLFFWPPIDVAVVCAHYMKNERPWLKDFKLGTIAKHLGIIAQGDLHDAMTDIRLTHDVYRRFDRS